MAGPWGIRMIDGVLWFFKNLLLAFYNIGYALTHLGQWLNWSDSQSMMRFIYYGGSRELFFAALLIFVLATALGMWRNQIMWAMVRVLEGIANTVGRFFAWAGLFMVLQQIMIIFLQRLFRVSEISVGPLGMDFTKDLSWYGEELKLYNAIIICMCATYTFVQGGHVRVDLIYSAVRFRTKRVIDMFGSLFFMMPMATLIWMYAWFFLWRHLVTPKVSASDTLERLMRKSQLLKWNVETIGFSPSGFDAYFLFKILLVTFTFMIFLQAVAFFFRSYLEWKEGEASANKYLDKDVRGNGEEAVKSAY
ncbi:C4-dicarboxylate ABC transporter permease [Rhodobacteraceae bacterium R_SAG10]|jgi:TRAP-type mannitol/chloroaromatic compound transport system permease small subunit|nr:C4-dicarboxylate ABC transporter permease [Rhodobacteraceae bacterium R_SAG10]